MILRFSHKKKDRLLINITSLIDVLFLLLIFFMVSSTFLEQPGMKLELPSAQSAEVSRLESLVLYIGPDEEIVLNNRVVGLDSLEIVMAGTVSLAEEKTLVLRADRRVPHGTVVRVIDIAKRVGLEKLVVGTKMEEE
ncbi:MAG: biopolymer transporter ExbD [Candidatus Krumholzibacteriota bacterium]|nr:biopolymer transporter ExbD [Candidatus Krumholzibacteriota bacterium]